MPKAPPKYRPIPSGSTKRRENRPVASNRGYGRRWAEYSRARLQQYPRCDGVLISGKRVHAGACNGHARCTDHIQAVTGPDDPMFFELTNHQSLSLECNSLKMQKVDHARR